MHRLAAILVAVLPLVAAGCGDSTGPRTLAGTYNLRSIDGDPVPFVLAEAEDFRHEIISGFVRLNPDRSFEAMNNYQLTNGTDVRMISLLINGAYERRGNEVTLRFPNSQGALPASVTAIWDVGRLTIDDDGHLWLYER